MSGRGRGLRALGFLRRPEGYCHVSKEVAKRIRVAEPPVDNWERVVLRRFRAL